MLRAKLGDEQFFQALRTYLERYAYSVATTEDFRDVMEEVSGIDLGYFFDQWAYSYGVPSLKYGLFQQTINSTRFLNLMLQQNQSARIFDLEVLVKINTTAGSHTYILRSTAFRQNFLIPLQGAYQSIQIDPDRLVLMNPVPTSTTYISGAPKIVATSEQLDFQSETPPQTITLDFSSAVTIPSGAIRLVGAITGEKPISASYNSTTMRLTLTLPQTLEPDSYQVIVTDSIANASGLPLDGEMPGNEASMTLPSGDGMAGGDFIFPFTIQGVDPCAYADISGNHLVEFDDITAVLANWGLSYPGDPTGDGIITFDDLTRVLACWGHGAQSGPGFPMQ